MTRLVPLRKTPTAPATLLNLDHLVALDLKATLVNQGKESEQWEFTIRWLADRDVHTFPATQANLYELRILPETMHLIERWKEVMEKMNRELQAALIKMREIEQGKQESSEATVNRGIT